MRRSLPLLATLTVVFAAPISAQPLNPPANMYMVSNTRTDLVAVFNSLERCQAAAAAHKIIMVGSGPVSVLLVCVPTQ
jgi:hypothetical protein